MKFPCPPVLFFLLFSCVLTLSAEPGSLSGEPRLDFLMDAFIAPDGAGGWYLTGTAGTLDEAGACDFDYNRGAPLWHSADLENWTVEGYAWDRPAALAAGKPKIGIWLDWSAPGERLDALLAQATTTPRLYQIKGDWYLLCAMNSQNVLLQKSTSGKAEGPFEDFAYLVTRGPEPSFFVASSGDVYLVYAEGWIAKMDPSLEKLAEAPRPLKVASAAGDGPLLVGERNVALFERGGKFHVLAPRHQVRDGKASHDAVLWTAGDIDGPYTSTETVLAGFGPASVFQKPDGSWHAVSALPTATTGGKPKILPIP